MRFYSKKSEENKSGSFSNSESKTSKGTNYPLQFVDNRPEAITQMKMKGMLNNSAQNKQAIQLQKMVNNGSSETQQTIQKKENNTGLPENLKTGMENLSGMSMDDVKVHRNSAKPAQLQAHAYAQGTDIHLGPGQEKHLPHELGHVVQQKEGRVKPTMQMKGKVDVNDDTGLEKEADVMGADALSSKSEENDVKRDLQNYSSVSEVHQLAAVPPWNNSFSISTTALIVRFKMKNGGDASTPNDFEVTSIESTSSRPPVFIENVKQVNQGQHKVAYKAIVTALQLLAGKNIKDADNTMGKIIETSGVVVEDVKPTITISMAAKTPKEADDLVAKMHNYIAAKQADSPSWVSEDKEQLKGKGEVELGSTLMDWQKADPASTSKSDVSNFLQQPKMRKLFDATGRNKVEKQDAVKRAMVELKIQNTGLVDKHQKLVERELRKYSPY